MKIVATIEARTGSTRLPIKVLKNILGEPMLSRIVERVARSQLIDEIVIATTTRSRDSAIVKLASDLNVNCFRGSENDILSRLAGAVSFSKANVLVSLTGDNPFIDPVFIDDMILFFKSKPYDYVASTHMMHARTWPEQKTFPTGLSAQVVWAKHVTTQNNEVKNDHLRAMGLYSIYEREDERYRRGAFHADGKYLDWRHPDLRLTVDTPEDFLLAEQVYKQLLPNNPNFSTIDAIRLILSDESLRFINSNIRQKIAHEELKGKC